ncbi:hypothetical protein C8F04DRAFT_1236601 [Mycena alexandri]|uniref:Uncharacterized protein n=1 Tax=Mycena alexandri TaxID=1745969 RepID=A0AAD6SPV1_9AGAR|nr:hypothetical protein C8F04DRAFT_1236601 [Mycena alexandri]
MNHHLGLCPSLRRTTIRSGIPTLPTHRHSSLLSAVRSKMDAFAPTFRAYSTELRNSVITSLRPANLKSSDFVDLSGILCDGGPGSNLSYEARLKMESTYLIAFGLSGRDAVFQYKFSKAKVPFPGRAWGYLYYRPSSAWTPVAGSVRLRINSDDAHGSDLLLPNGLPWQIIIPQIVLQGLVSKSEVWTCKNVFGWQRALYPETVLFSLDQLFSISMEQTDLRLTIVGRSSRGMRLALFTKQRLFGDPAPRYPFKGRILARFELSPDKALVFMRFVKIVEPIVCCEPEYDGRTVAPKEGELLSYRDHRMSPSALPAPWSLNMDPEKSTQAADALRLSMKPDSSSRQRPSDLPIPLRFSLFPVMPLLLAVLLFPEFDALSFLRTKMTNNMSAGSGGKTIVARARRRHESERQRAHHALCRPSQTNPLVHSAPVTRLSAGSVGGPSSPRTIACVRLVPESEGGNGILVIYRADYPAPSPFHFRETSYAIPTPRRRLPTRACPGWVVPAYLSIVRANWDVSERR